MVKSPKDKDSDCEPEIENIKVDYKALLHKALALPDAHDADRLRRLVSAIESGTYKVNAEGITEKLLVDEAKQDTSGLNGFTPSQKKKSDLE